ncbi:MAG: putative antitoxin [Thermoplasmata archaeon]|jgi:predicted CopG family antitoxin|nr:putative antitoxin [Thermoplasmata archaeon]
MTKQVALADATYERLRSHKQPGESFSEVIERLLSGQRDPLSFPQAAPRSRVPARERLAQVEADRKATRMDA